MTQKTPLYQMHVDAHAKLVDFGGWEMPLHYGSQLEEHKIVRENAGLFDVSHMTIIDVMGEQASDYLRYLLANDIAKLETQGKALYSCMLNEKGGIIDDLIVYFLTPTFYRLVVNAATRDVDLAWLNQQKKSFQVTLNERMDLTMIAAQGPKARHKLTHVFGTDCGNVIASLKSFHATCLGMTNDGFYAPEAKWGQAEAILVACTGYTGEDGFEIIVPNTQAVALWQTLIHVGFTPCGLGARDTLRLEAGLNLYGVDMNETTTPFESNLAWTVALTPPDRDFIGRDALVAQKNAGVSRQLVGFILAERGGVLRGHQTICAGSEKVGEITSGTFSPTLNQSIALARIATTGATHYTVKIRDKIYPVERVKPPFVKREKEK